MNLNLQRSLDVLLETRNLTVAATMLRPTQSALSLQWAQLRTQFANAVDTRVGPSYLQSAQLEMANNSNLRPSNPCCGTKIVIACDFIIDSYNAPFGSMEK